MLSLYLGSSPHRYATLPTNKIVHSTTPYYKVLLQYKVLLRTTDYTVLLQTLYHIVLLRFTKYIQSTTPALLCTTQYFSVLQSTTPVLLQYYSSTTLYYSSTTPILLCTTTTTRLILVTYMKRHLHCKSNRNQPPTSPNIAPATKMILMMMDPRYI